MSSIDILIRFNSLPQEMKKEVSDFVEFLLQKSKIKKPIKKREFGVLKGKINLTDDFDTSIDEFKEYM